jgi:hypothetical protein
MDYLKNGREETVLRVSGWKRVPNIHAPIEKGIREHLNS